MSEEYTKLSKFYQKVRNQLTEDEENELSSIRSKYVFGLFISASMIGPCIAISGKLTKSHSNYVRFILTCVMTAIPVFTINKFIRSYYMKPYLENIYKKYSDTVVNDSQNTESSEKDLV